LKCHWQPCSFAQCKPATHSRCSLRAHSSSLDGLCEGSMAGCVPVRGQLHHISRTYLARRQPSPVSRLQSPVSSLQSPQPFVAHKTQRIRLYTIPRANQDQQVNITRTHQRGSYFELQCIIFLLLAQYVVFSLEADVNPSLSTSLSESACVKGIKPNSSQRRPCPSCKARLTPPTAQDHPIRAI
jgi:hypothetical protein